MSQALEPSTVLVSDLQIPAGTAEQLPTNRAGFLAGTSNTLRSALRLDESEAMQQSGSVKPVSECLREIDIPRGRQLLRETLARKPFPHFEPAPDRASCWIRIEANGTRTVGRFVERSFVAES